MPRKKPTDKYSYVLDYIREACNARISLREICSRAIRAYEGKCQINYYHKNIASYRDWLTREAPDRLADFDAMCSSLPDEKNMVVNEAIETSTNMIMGGAGQFEYQPYDPYLEQDTETAERLMSAAEFFYKDNKVDSLMGNAARNINLQGAAYLHIKPSKDGNKFNMSLIDAWRMLNDPHRNKTNRARYRGFTQDESWSSVRADLKKQGSGYILSSINEVDTYIEDVRNYINGDETSSRHVGYLGADIDLFYGTYRDLYAQASTDNTGKKDDPKEKARYQGDDVEVSYLYDLEADIYFRVINRRFIVEAKHDPISKNVECKYYDKNGKKKTFTKKIKVDCPIVEIPYLKVSWQTYPITPLFLLFEDFDKLCSMESVLAHNFSIVAPITFIGSSFDAEKLSQLSAIAGEVMEGTTNTIGVMNKTHDVSSPIAYIQRKEERIRKALKATDQYQLQSMLGDRATASEVGSANGAVSQGLNSVFANIEDGMSEAIDIFFKMFIIYSDKDSLQFPHKGTYSEASKDELMGDSLIRAKLKSVIKLEQQQQSKNALQVLGYLNGAEGVKKKELVGTLVPIAMQGIVSRTQAENFVDAPSKVSPEMLKVVTDKMDQKEEDPRTDEERAADEMDTSQFSADELEQALAMAAGGQQMSQAPVAPNMMAPGTNPADAGIIANQQAGY